VLHVQAPEIEQSSGEFGRAFNRLSEIRFGSRALSLLRLDNA
jgi:hypothetical protein